MTRKPARTPARGSGRKTNTNSARSARIRRKIGVKTVVATAFLVAEAAATTVLLTGLVVFDRFAKQLPDVAVLVNNVSKPRGTTIWSADGVLLGRIDNQDRVPITLDEVNQHLQDATVAIEDHRFYSHFGIDLKGIARAAIADFTGSLSKREGASTLTQQLVRNVGAFGVGRQKLYSRKVREALIAMRIEQVYSKHEILSLYLNNVYYGAGAYGVEAAARTYFGLHASQLDISQAALIAGLPQLPSAYCPFDHPNRALRRRDEVLTAMKKYGYITDQQEQSAIAETMHFTAPKSTAYDFKAPYFVWYVLNDISHRYGRDFLNTGVKIVTTLNYGMQRSAERVLENGLESASYTGCNQGCLICLDNSNGYIRAMVGGRSFAKSQFNIAVSGLRQPGSTFKLFDYASAFDTGKAGIDSTFEDKPIAYPGGHGKTVHDFEGYTYRYMTCRDAVAHSVNTIAVQVAALVGIRTVISYAQSMGITSHLAPYLPTAIGASAVHPIDLASAYSTVATNGTRHTPMAIQSISDADGNIIEQDLPSSQSNILKQSTISQLNDAFSAVVDYGTGTAAKGNQSNGIIADARGKTGTTGDFRDAWFAGYTPELTTVIWSGDVHHGKYLPMANGQGGVICAPIWHNFMVTAIPLEQKYLAVQKAVNQQPQSNMPLPEQPPPPKPTPPTVTSPTGGAAGTATTVNPSAPADTNTGVPGTSPALGDTSSPNGPVATQPPALPAQNSVEPVPQPIAPGEHANGAQVPPVTAPPTVALPHARTTKPGEKMVSVTLCAETHERATMWCPVTITVKMPASEARKLKYCTKHKPPPGAG